MNTKDVVNSKFGCARCSDERCLFDGGKGVSHAEFVTVTEETREGKGLWESCVHCGLVINRTGVAPDDVKSFYNEVYQDKNSFQQGNKVDARQHFEIRLESIRPRAEYLANHVNKNSVIFELGAGSGELLYLLKPHARRCYANELAQEFVDFMNDDLGIEASSENYLEAVPPEKWDLAISVGTLDHIYDTREFVEKLFEDLKPGGLLYVEVPNDRQALKDFMPGVHAGSFRRFMYQIAHYYSFTFETLRRLLEEVGFSVDEEFSRHDYSLINYLNWCMTGTAQRSIADAKSDSRIFVGDSRFEREMNDLLADADKRFREVITKNRLGESICILARKPR